MGPILAGALGGVLAGTEVAGLLFFLNPELDFRMGPVLRSILLLGAVFAALGACLTSATAALLPAGRGLRAFPWILTLVLVSAAGSAWAHASLLSFYLPPGIGERLIKAAFLLTVLAFLGFYTALLHSVPRRRYGPKSRLLLALVVVAAAYVPFERRESYRGQTPKPPVLSGFMAPDRPHLLVVGLPSASLDALLPLAGQGRLPFLGGALQSGAYGRVAPLTPVRPKALWTTLATGKWPFKHGIAGDRIQLVDRLAPGGQLRIMPLGLGWSWWGRVCGPRRSANAEDRRALPVWTLLSRLGLQVVVTSWPVTYPAEPVGRVISDRFFAAASAPEATFPEDLALRAQRFRPEPADVSQALRAGSPPSERLLAAAGGDLWRTSVTRVLLAEGDAWEAAFTVLPGLAEASRAGVDGFAAVHFEGSSRPVDRRAAEALAAYYALLDREIGRLWETMHPPRLLVVVGAYGVEPSSGWQRLGRALLPGKAGDGSGFPSGDGVLLLLGDGVRAGVQLDRAEAVDLAPTLLYALGFPLARDLDGQVLTEALESGFLARRPLSFVPSYEALPGR